MPVPVHPGIHSHSHSPPPRDRIPRPTHNPQLPARTGTVARRAEQFQLLAKQQEEHQQKRFTARPLKIASRLNTNVNVNVHKPLPVQPATSFPGSTAHLSPDVKSRRRVTPPSPSPQASRVCAASPAQVEQPLPQEDEAGPSQTRSAPSTTRELDAPSPQPLSSFSRRPFERSHPRIASDDSESLNFSIQQHSTPPRPGGRKHYGEIALPRRSNSASSSRRQASADDVFCLQHTADTWHSQRDDSCTQQSGRTAVPKQKYTRARASTVSGQRHASQSSQSSESSEQDNSCIRRRSSIRYKRHSNTPAASTPVDVPPSRYSEPVTNGHQRRRSSIRYIKDTSPTRDSMEVSRPSIPSPSFMADNKAKFLAEYMRQNPDVEALAVKEKNAPEQVEQDKSWPWGDEELPLQPPRARGRANSVYPRVSTASVDTLLSSPSDAPAELGLQLQVTNSTAEGSSRPSSLGLGDVHAHGVIPAPSFRGSIYTEVSTDESKAMPSRPRSVHWPDSDVSGDCMSSDAEWSYTDGVVQVRTKPSNIYDDPVRAARFEDAQRVPSARSKSAMKSASKDSARAAHLEDTQRRLGGSSGRDQASQLSPEERKLFPWLPESAANSPVLDREAMLVRTMNALTRNAAQPRPPADDPALDDDGEPTADAYKSAASRGYKTNTRTNPKPQQTWDDEAPGDEIVASAYQGTADEGLGQGFGYGGEETPEGPQRPRVQATTQWMASSDGEGDEQARQPLYVLSPMTVPVRPTLCWGTLIPLTNSSRIPGLEKAPRGFLRLLGTFSVRSGEAPVSSSHRRRPAGCAQRRSARVGVRRDARRVT